jgi:periplasmic copper chaperone A
MRNRICAWLAACLLPFASVAAEPVNISGAWARATAPGQEVGAAYMVLQSPLDATLIKITSDAAGSVEIHSMTMDHGVMEMRMQATLPLAAGKPVRLAPGGFHLMLFDLKKPLKAGDQLTLTLTFRDNHGKTSTQALRVPVKAGTD